MTGFNCRLYFEEKRNIREIFGDIRNIIIIFEKKRLLLFLKDGLTD